MEPDPGPLTDAYVRGDRMSGTDDDVRSRVRKRLAKTPTSEVMAAAVDEIVLKDLDRADGSVGASKLTAILDIPYDHHDRAGEQAEAAWETKSRQL